LAGRKPIEIVETLLKEILGEIEAGKFIITVADEDVHTKVENVLVQRIGDAGKKLHTARSRNDQILVDTRLYSKFQLLILGSEIAALCGEHAFDYLDAPIVRLAGRDMPIPYNRNLEYHAVPQVEDIINAARKLGRGEVYPLLPYW